jgi:hypothetical protein
MAAMGEDLEQLKQRIPLLEYLQRHHWTGHRARARSDSAAAVAVEQILARVDVEGGMGFLMQGTESDERLFRASMRRPRLVGL